jgi:hypothetical protein
MGITRPVPTVGIQCVAQREARMMFAKDREAQEKLVTMKPQKPRFLGLQNKDKPKIRKP